MLKKNQPLMTALSCVTLCWAATAAAADVAKCDRVAAEQAVEKAYALADEPEALEREARVAVALCEEFAPGHNALATALEMQGFFDQAIAEYRLAQKYQPDWALPYLGEGDVHMLRNQRTEASVAFKKAREHAADEGEQRDADAGLEGSMVASNDNYAFKAASTIASVLNVGEPMFRPRAPMAYDDEDEKEDIVVTPVGRHINFALEFSVNSAEITDQVKTQLDEIGRALKGAKAGEVYLLNGHASSDGAAAYNKKLSARRAKAARDYLIKTYELSPELLEAKGLGSEKPILKPDGTEDMIKSRRVAVGRPYDK